MSIKLRRWLAITRHELETERVYYGARLRQHAHSIVRRSLRPARLLSQSIASSRVVSGDTTSNSSGRTSSGTKSSLSPGQPDFTFPPAEPIHPKLDPRFPYRYSPRFSLTSTLAAAETGGDGGGAAYRRRQSGIWTRNSIQPGWPDWPPYPRPSGGLDNVDIKAESRAGTGTNRTRNGGAGNGSSGNSVDTPEQVTVSAKTSAPESSLVATIRGEQHRLMPASLQIGRLLDPARLHRDRHHHDLLDHPHPFARSSSSSSFPSSSPEPSPPPVSRTRTRTPASLSDRIAASAPTSSHRPASDPILRVPVRIHVDSNPARTATHPGRNPIQISAVLGRSAYKLLSRIFNRIRLAMSTKRSPSSRSQSGKSRRGHKSDPLKSQPPTSTTSITATATATDTADPIATSPTEPSYRTANIPGPPTASRPVEQSDLWTIAEQDEDQFFAAIFAHMKDPVAAHPSLLSLPDAPAAHDRLLSQIGFASALPPVERRRPGVRAWAANTSTGSAPPSNRPSSRVRPRSLSSQSRSRLNMNPSDARPGPLKMNPLKMNPVREFYYEKENLRPNAGGGSGWN